MKFKQILRKIFFLPPLATVLIAVPSLTFVFIGLAMGLDGVIAYISYALAAYGLVILVTGFKSIVEAVRRGVKNNPLTLALMKIPIVNRYFCDPLFKARVSLYFGLIINVVYIAIKLISGIYYQSIWLIALAIYYILLAVMRAFLVGYGAQYGFGESIAPELRRYRLIGILLLVLNLSLTAIVVLVVYRNEGFEYAGLLIYAMAAYAFYSITLAIINIVKVGSHGSPAASAVRVINLVSALVSMLSLTTAMLAQFGGDDSKFRRIMTGTVGGAVCVIVLGIAAFMIIKSTWRLKKLTIRKDD